VTDRVQKLSITILHASSVRLNCVDLLRAGLLCIKYTLPSQFIEN